LPLLHDLGIGCVVNVTPNVPNYFSDHNVAYHQVPILDTWNQHIQTHFRETFDFINRNRQRGTGVLVHCQAGISRSAAFVIGYLMENGGMTLDQAYQQVLSRRSVISPNLSFMGELKEFELHLMQHGPFAPGATPPPATPTNLKAHHHHQSSSSTTSSSNQPPPPPCCA
jgi:dual specificity MAP kinase phosphatase